MGAEPGDALTPLGTDARALLTRGVAAGVISAAQRDALLALDADAAPAERSTPVAIAYWLGAALVVFALGWFLVDRWKPLGAGGVLAVTACYAVAFGLVAFRLARERAPFAAGVALMLVTLTAPLAAWALMRLSGEWPDMRTGDPLLRYEPFMATRRLVVELSAVLAGLLALRFVRPAPAPDGVRRTPLGLPLAAATALAFAEVMSLVSIAAHGDDLYFRGWGWAFATTGALVFGVAYVVDRRQPPPAAPDREDFAAWLYVAACVPFQLGLITSFDTLGTARHALAAIAVLQLATGARLGRRILLVAGGVNVIWYLGWLAFERFKYVLSFPFLLAAFGLTVLGLAVLVQRRFPELVRGTGRSHERPALPGGMLTAWAPAVLTFALLAAEVPRARARQDEYVRRERVERDRMHTERAVRRRPERVPSPPSAPAPRDRAR